MDDDDDRRHADVDDAMQCNAVNEWIRVSILLQLGMIYELNSESFFFSEVRRTRRLLLYCDWADSGSVLWRGVQRIAHKDGLIDKFVSKREDHEAAFSSCDRLPLLQAVPDGVGIDNGNDSEGNLQHH